jgi:hypothetical protein
MKCPEWIMRLSWRINMALFGTNESLCSRAWRLRNRYFFWRNWVKFFGPRHCRRSWERYFSGQSSK